MLLDRERDRLSSPKTTPVRAPGGTGERTLVCAMCDHEITDEDSRTAVQGAHEHTFVNPAGFAYVIGCFRAAPGCTGRGHHESAFSWFPGWTWQVAACARCEAHLGWCYRNADQEFHGLITAALRPAGRAAPGG